MRFIPAGWAPHDVEEELLGPPTRAYVRFPELEVIDRPDWGQLTCNLFPTGGFNEVSRAKLSDADADRVIDQTIAHYSERGLVFRWSVMPGSTPHDLASRLFARGLRSSEVVGMARSTTIDHRPRSGVTVEEVGLDRLDEFSRVMSEGWGTPLGALGDYNRLALGDPRRAFRLFLGSINGEPAAAGAAMLFPRSIYLLGSVVLERFRGRGLYSALITARLSVARGLGISLATTHARASTSAPLLAHAGFDEWFRYPSFS
jgi:GNAT superfamily N-acetyltransferase